MGSIIFVTVCLLVAVTIPLLGVVPAIRERRRRRLLRRRRQQEMAAAFATASALVKSTADSMATMSTAAERASEALQAYGDVHQPRAAMLTDDEDDR